MSVSDKHWEYMEHLETWQTMRDCEDGERTIKLGQEKYLPKPSGFTKQPDGGTAAYNAYVQRAVFPEILQPTRHGMAGVIHRVEAQISGLEEGKPLAYMWERATRDGLPLEVFHQQITAEILLAGRYSILTDVSDKGDGEPFFVGYQAEKLINWDEKTLDFYVLDESAKVRSTEDGANEFAWVDKPQHRVLRLQDGKYTQQVYGEKDQGTEPITPQMRGGKALDQIPFVVVNSQATSLTITPPPLWGVARSSLTIYRLSADYFFQLFMTGQETFVIIGDMDNLPTVLGAGVTVNVPPGGDAKMVGPSGVGIAAHRIAILDERENAVAAGVKLFDTKKAAESGEALRLRAAANYATLTTIARASASALERSLRYAAMFVGQDPNEIVVKPNLAFVDTKMAPQDVQYLVAGWQAGAFSYQTLYDNLQRGEIASSERTAEEELQLISQDQIDHPVVAQAVAADQANQANNGNPSANQGGGV